MQLEPYKRIVGKVLSILELDVKKTEKLCGSRKVEISNLAPLSTCDTVLTVDVVVASIVAPTLLPFSNLFPTTSRKISFEAGEQRA